MLVKICGITNCEDALAAVAAGASALGFNFFQGSPRFLTPERAARVIEALPGSVLKVGIFVNEAVEHIQSLVSELGLDVAQLYGEPELAPAGVRVWRAVRVGPGFKPDELIDPAAEAFLLDPAPASVWGGSGLSFDWRIARGARRKIIIAGGLDESNVRRAICEARPWGVDACSRLEREPGLKDNMRMARFIEEALRAAAEQEAE